MADCAITVSGLTKSFGPVQALAGVDFCVRRGELFGLLGPNGAGKTTTIRILTGLSRADAGTAHIYGWDVTRDPKAAQALFGVVPDESNLYPELTGFENLCFCGALYGLRKAQRQARARELLSLFGLEAAADRKFGGYSKGMKRKLTIAAAIVHEPRVLFLDEPTTGIDVASARQVRRLVAELHQRGTTILLTTHYIEEAERLCQRIAFIVDGRIVRLDTMENLLAPVRGNNVLSIHVRPLPKTLPEALQARFPRSRVHIEKGDTVHLESPEPVQMGPVVAFLEDQGLEVLEIRRLRPSLEDVFVQTTGIEATRMAQGGSGKR